MTQEVLNSSESKFVDAHVHLSDPEYAEITDKLIEDAAKSNVIALVTNSMNLETSLHGLQLAKKYEGCVYAALGIHPWTVKELAQDELEDVVQLILDHSRDPMTVAIGETGLDPQYIEKAKDKTELQELQHRVFHEMLKTAEKTSLPIIIHSRGTSPQIVDMLPSYRVKKVLLHWFSKPLELLPEIASRNYYVSEGPPTVYSKSAREIIRQVPLENLLTETDGPVRYFGKPFKGKTTMPSYIPMIVEAIAEIKNTRRDDVARQILLNFGNFFNTRPWVTTSIKRQSEDAT
jgi:TatD DNase family protein